ncbi:acyltransferase family protein [Acetobacter oeni]|uniref:acyltransferase family protein n=1 Tax=Acetobacter oeni TaxID=304077 RepID=UPI0011BDDF8F|nr:acyltransferase [Acetobacter oeni]MBB3881395.1 peptidoglycan/LPS O-acetylase OafA/YrhL [Acetobacter oeni]NHO18262.1 acyltransferase family protein [Acetobacter oeni]
MKNIPELTGVRGIAALWVFLSHIQKLAAVALHSDGVARSSFFFLGFHAVDLFFFLGFHAVDLFFVLSGFILMHAHEKQFEIINRSAIEDFFIARFFRIYPLNTFVLFCLLPIVILLPGYVSFERSYTDFAFSYKANSFSLLGFIQTLLLVQTWTFAKLGTWNIVSWTLSAEVLGYLMFPTLAYLASKIKSATTNLFLAVTSLTILTFLLILGHHANNNPTGVFGAVRMFFCFCAGITINRACGILPDDIAKVTSYTNLAAVCFLIATIFIPVLGVLEVFSFSALIFGLYYQKGEICRFLSSALVLFMGRISFSFYIIHYIVIQLIYWATLSWLPNQNLFMGIVLLTVVTIFCFLVAFLLYTFVERPSHRIGREILKRVKNRRHALGRVVS